MADGRSKQSDSPMELARGREYRDREILGDNEVWSVYEMASSGDHQDGPSLVFANTKVARRVRQYPVDWRDLPDAELYGISHSR